ncbi:DUF523 domain-containing protein [uncultured Fusobacterium sp.]|jgi:uncharacterized protein YbbK (DUF523 family)|uniref:DUF523 domain-containing protein n=1 Tax=uncultured Fusobacterium sp. TaxID=159267 RepID=UPI0025CCF904|nr:DUF523 domain-containing protein [uncultured Fusobacterium sp.]
MNILISGCLLGLKCRYDGKEKKLPEIEKLIKLYNLIPVCPEQLGGLPTPRIPAERVKDRVITQVGADVTEEYQLGAKEALKIAKLYNCKKAILKEKSPSCGCGKIYDGTFSRNLTDGNGVTANLLIDNGIEIFGESEIEKFLK